ncbi:unnamed protein product [Oppiella nova]|uniref:Fatty acid hydroxylase domain-containing protein n=1 Tax=Oppiella nova TaxID=334625 RepID=A0A7R9LKS3_9ACAR|nr:unnamed protein product [Oppiella nova]CAG2164617.1 unnamed protein product [Oppiella nova]
MHTISVWIHSNYSIIELSTDSFWTWIIALLSVEFVYYWCHRAGHEVNLFWANHQYHHSGEDLNLSVASRFTAIEANYILFYLGTNLLAIILPPQVLLIQTQFAIIYQYTIHTTIIGKYGPLEHVLMTPSLHRVHHGSNPYCIDKNYGAILCVWDRLFGTHELESDETVVYGLVEKAPGTCDYSILTLFYYKSIYDKCVSMSQFKWKIFAVLKKPSWTPGSVENSELLDKPPGHNYYVDSHVCLYLYILIHSAIIVSTVVYIEVNGVIIYPLFVILIALEFIIRVAKSNPVRPSEIIINCISGLLAILTSVWIHSNYNIIELSVDSFWTWIIALLSVEFVYYWCHRAGHEVNLFWANHQYHHSGEDLNLSVASRFTAIEANYILFYLGTNLLAIILPPQVLLIQTQFAIIYQYTIHTTIIGKYGPLEHVLMTPSLHRVHHGSNPYCIDKNYGAILCVWDRLFGTHELESDETVVYGLVEKAPGTCDYSILTLFYYKSIYDKCVSMSQFKWKIFAVLKKPSWTPGLVENSDLLDKPPGHNYYVDSHKTESVNLIKGSPVFKLRIYGVIATFWTTTAADINTPLKDDKEFYRYGPKGLIAHYTMPGIDIDLARSSDSSVFLKHVSIHSDGSYRWVRVPPESGPSITSSRLEYRVGDIGIDFAILINQILKVYLKCGISTTSDSTRDSEYDIVNTTQSYGEGLESSSLTLKFVAQYKHYRDGRLGFKCTAITPTIYITSDAVFTDPLVGGG